MSISILEHELPEENYYRYDLTFFDIQIPILLTSSPPMVDQWIADLSVSRPQPFLVGLDVEWRPNFSNTNHPVATIQLCTTDRHGPACLIFQILHSPHVPRLLIDFLGDTANTFVGVGIEEDVEKLLCNYNLRVAKTVDLRDMVPREMKKAGLKTMAKEILGKDVQKPKRISRSRWDYEWLTSAQVQYACLDAFLSFEIGRRLSDNPQVSMVMMLNGDNYKIWNKRAKLVITEIKGLDHLTTKHVRLEGDLTDEQTTFHNEWDVKDLEIRSALMSMLEDDILYEYDHHETTKDLCDGLEAGFGVYTIA